MLFYAQYLSDDTEIAKCTVQDQTLTTNSYNHRTYDTCLAKNRNNKQKFKKSRQDKQNNHNLNLCYLFHVYGSQANR